MTKQSKTLILSALFIAATLIIAGCDAAKSDKTAPPPNDIRNTEINNTSNTSETNSTTPSANTTGTTSESATATSGTAYTLAEVSTHNSEKDCWFAVDGAVYKLTDFISSGSHKAGMQVVIDSCGTDATATFTQSHQGKQRAYNELAAYKIGTLQ